MTDKVDVPTELTSEHMDRMREFIDVPLNVEQYNEAAGSDVIRHYALGIGDENPLWLDDEYASSTRFGGRVAPPTFVYSIFDCGVVRGLPVGTLPMHVTSELEFLAPIWLGDTVRAESRIVSVESRDSKRAGQTAFQVSENVYRNQDGVMVARVHQTLAAVANSGLGAGVYSGRPQHEYSEQEYEEIRRDVLAEVRRGSEPRFWEDVEVGDDIPPVVKGPIDVISQICYYAGALGSAALYKGVESRWLAQERMHRTPDPLHVLDSWRLDHVPGAGHLKGDPMRSAPPHDNGNQRVAWCAHLLTNWAGDDGNLKRLRVEIRRPNVYGDTQWIRGVVDRRFEIADEGLVEISIVAKNQHGEETTRGRATVSLPRKPVA